ncbi:MAG: H+/Na+-translocating ferredoxin:NAD+ oxidoreductase subunit, partial [Pseudomonadota bacterium]|nr:H+/Na+-translocating ferredoxin:NAD+ oxidoreductase subunit [Pseudomonadota bacterium]
MSNRPALPAGLRLDARKTASLQCPLRTAPAPRIAVVAIDQGSSDAAEPIVTVGTRVGIGTPIARAASNAATDLHSPIAGVVVEIATRSTVAGVGRCILIENDATDARDPALAPVDWRALDGVTLLDCLRKAGIAGLGGAAFPAAGKLALARANAVAHLVLNGAECEPWICCDDALMRERAADVVLGGQVMLAASGATRCTIAIEDDKPEAIAAITAAIAAEQDDRVELVELPALYPLGAERQLIEAITGREVPHDALPPTIGVVCQNVGTAAAVARFVGTGEPLVSRIVTVTGSGVACPGNLEVRIGTPIADLIAACGGYQRDPARLIVGGAMTGRSLTSDLVPTTKGVNCIVAATLADLAVRDPEMPCIRCGDCAMVCPARLLPQQLHRAAQADDRDGLARLGLADCIECGCCDYVCPSQIPLTA